MLVEQAAPLDAMSTTDDTAPHAPAKARRTQRAAVVVAAVVVSTRVVLGLGLAGFGVRIFGMDPTWRRGTSIDGSPTTLVDTFLRWDADLFAKVGKVGYAASDRDATSFFPVYPQLCHALASLTPLTYEQAALIVSWTGFFFATWALVALVRTLWPERDGARAAVLLAWWPGSVFLLGGYSEATFLAIAGWFCVALVCGRLLPAALLAAAASGTRPEGVLLGAVLVGWLLWERRGIVRTVVLGAVSAVGLAAFSAFCWARYGDAFAYFGAQASWHRTHTVPFRPVVASLRAIVLDQPLGGVELTTGATATFLVDDLAVLAALVSAAFLLRWAVVRRDLRPLAALSALYVLVVASNGVAGVSPEAAVRVLMCAVPLFVVVERLRSEHAWTAVVAGSVAIAVPCQLLYNLGYWFT